MLHWHKIVADIPAVYWGCLLPVITSISAKCESIVYGPAVLLGPGLIIVEISRSHSDTLRLPWTSDQPDAETSTWQQTTITGGRQPWPRRDSNPQSQQASAADQKREMYYRVTQKGEESYSLRSNRRGKNSVILSAVRINLKVIMSYKQRFKIFIFCWPCILV